MLLLVDVNSTDSINFFCFNWLMKEETLEERGGGMRGET